MFAFAFAFVAVATAAVAIVVVVVVVVVVSCVFLFLSAAAQRFESEKMSPPCCLSLPIPSIILFRVLLLLLLAATACTILLHCWVHPRLLASFFKNRRRRLSSLFLFLTFSCFTSLSVVSVGGWSFAFSWALRFVFFFFFFFSPPVYFFIHSLHYFCWAALSACPIKFDTQN